MVKFRERSSYRLKYQYDMVQAITGQSRRAIRKAMYRKGLSNETEDFAAYILNYLKRERRECGL